MSDAPLVSKPERGRREFGKMSKNNEKILKQVKDAVAFAIAHESKDLKPDEKIDVSIDVTPEGVVVHAKKVKKDE